MEPLAELRRGAPLRGAGAPRGEGAQGEGRNHRWKTRGGFSPPSPESTEIVIVNPGASVRDFLETIFLMIALPA